jgi:RNAse (barnase) inhibitor barstar
LRVGEDKDNMKHNCEEHLKLVLRTLSHGAKSVVNQCQICKKQVGGAMSQQGINVSSFPLFDTSKDDERKSNRFKVKEDRYEYELFCMIKEKIKEHKDTDDPEVVDRIMKGIFTMATQERAALHNDSKFPLTNEPKLTKWVINFLKEDFKIYEKPRGKHMHTGKVVEPDLLLYPREHLIEKGFINNIFVIEVKHFDVMDDMHKKVSTAFWQTLTYNDSLFNISGNKVSPSFSLLFSNLSFRNQYEQLIFKEYVDLKSMWRTYKHMVNHSGVGILAMKESQSKIGGEIVDDEIGWIMEFATREYFSKTPKKYDGILRIHEPNVIHQRPAGNIF